MLELQVQDITTVILIYIRDSEECNSPVLDGLNGHKPRGHCFVDKGCVAAPAVRVAVRVLILDDQPP